MRFTHFFYYNVNVFHLFPFRHGSRWFPDTRPELPDPPGGLSKSKKNSKIYTFRVGIWNFMFIPNRWTQFHSAKYLKFWPSESSLSSLIRKSCERADIFSKPIPHSPLLLMPMVHLHRIFGPQNVEQCRPYADASGSLKRRRSSSGMIPVDEKLFSGFFRWLKTTNQIPYPHISDISRSFLMLISRECLIAASASRG